MSKIPQQVLDFLRSSAPFDLLETDDLAYLASKLTVAYLNAENCEELIEQQRGCLFLIHSGQFSVKDSPEPERHLSEGDFFACNNLLKKLDYDIQVKVDSPGLVYVIAGEVFSQCLDDYPRVNSFFQTYNADELCNEAVNDSNSIWLHRPIHEVISNKVVSAETTDSIHNGVSLMSKQNVSSLLIVEQNTLVGIITDRDIRNRVVAPQTPSEQALSTVMTAEPINIASHRTLFDALCLMSEHNIHHLPVLDRHTLAPVGMLSASDMIRHQRANVLFIINEISKATSLYELTHLSWQLPHYFAKHAKRLGDFDIAGKVLAQATDIMTRKLLDFFQQKHGNPPFDYCWLVYGSQAREDQTMGSDQDNSLLLAKHPDEHQAKYFANMAEYVCQGLGKCGIKLCEGNIMASNPKLCMSLEEAIAEAATWVNEPTTQSILKFNIFLDVRAVAGNYELLEDLQTARIPLFKQSIFLAALARQTAKDSVPLSIFQKFVYTKCRDSINGAEDRIDLKVSAVAILNNLVRIYALAGGLSMPSTLGRLNNLPEDSDLSEKDANNLRDIWLFLNRLRWRHQLHNSASDNLVSLSDLSSIEKHQLKAAFQAIRRGQQAILLKFSGGLG